MHRTVILAVGWMALGQSILTHAADEVPRPEHPRPDAVRAHWANLNGSWQFRFDPKDQGLQDRWFQADAGGFDHKITVPFGWESELSGIHDTKYRGVGWYRRTFSVPNDFPKDGRVWLHFGAVDWRADVWVNGTKVAEHEGGYTPFSADITDALKADGPNTLVVRAFDPTDPSLPTGKQVGWYTPTSGIWQTVWLESRPKAYIEGFQITHLGLEPRASARFRVRLAGLDKDKEDVYTLRIRSDDPTVREDSARVVTRGETETETLEPLVRSPKPWTPESPHLYNVTLTLEEHDGDVIDSVQTYFGLRTIGRGRYGDEPYERVLLNGKPIYLRGALDQSFNPKGVYTAPSDDFLKHDIELAKSLGLNFLRIHIKPDEPRRLYWADRLGMLIMEDMPNTWQQNGKARAAWERTMREAIVRDRNHPAIFAWVDFNETWGLGRPEQYKQDRDTQRWVEAMVALTSQLDPTRLVEDNSPCNYDHVRGTDFNSWHFYIDDHDKAKRHVEEVVERSEPGSPFNYCPGLKMNHAPLINSEYGSVSAGGGDRDVSWGFRDLTTLLRKQPKIQGYVYTELSDIEWEHNGFVNYDRTPKDFGYGAFVSGMTPADLQGADFVGYDAPPAIVARPDEPIRVPLFVSHYSDRKEPPTLRWWVAGYDDQGEKVEIDARERAVEWKAYGVTPQKPLEVKIKGPFVGALALTLVDGQKKRIAANFVNLVVQPETPAPRAQRLDDHTVALRFAPGDFSRATWSGGSARPPGKAYGRGQGSFTYRLKVPEAVVRAKPEAFELLLEASAKAGRERVDWPERVNRQDNPQTDVRKWPSTLEVTLNGHPVARVDLNDDPADARGVLSHLARRDHGSYGERVRLHAELPQAIREQLASGRPLVLRLAVPDDAAHPGGLCVFGATTGAYPFDPTLSLATRDKLPDDLGARPDDSVAIDRAESK